MEKKIYRLLIIFCLCFLLFACGNFAIFSVNAEESVGVNNNGYQTFEYARVNNVSLKDGAGNELIYIDTITTVRVLERAEEVSKISFDDESGTKEGYVLNTSFVIEKNSNIRIIVCLFILTTCAFITTLYFSFIKRHDY